MYAGSPALEGGHRQRAWILLHHPGLSGVRCSYLPDGYLYGARRPVHGGSSRLLPQCFGCDHEPVALYCSQIRRARTLFMVFHVRFARFPARSVTAQLWHYSERALSRLKQLITDGPTSFDQHTLPIRRDVPSWLQFLRHESFGNLEVAC